MDQVLTPLRNMIPRSETMLSPPPLKRQRNGENSYELINEITLASIPMSLLIPNDLDTPDSRGDDMPRLSLKPRTKLSPSSLPILKRKISQIPSISSELMLLAQQHTEAPRMRMKRRRSSMSSCGADNFGRFEVTPLMPLV